jgi:acetyltransferase-like isoleucine patch superfamily enzyme
LARSDPKIKTGKYCTISDDVELGENVIIHGFVNLYGCRIGKDSRVGTFVEIQKDVIIGDRVRIQSHSFLCSGTRIEDDVFIGHNVTFINDRYPTAPHAAENKWVLEKTKVQRGASLGSGAVILCGIEIGEGAVVGAGSVVNKNVPPHTIVAGVPAKIIRPLSLEERWTGGRKNEE